MSGRSSGEGGVIRKPLPANVPAQPQKFLLLGYITAAGDYQQKFMGSTQTIAAIWLGSPDDCEAAIVRAAKEYWVIDLLKLMQVPNKRSHIGQDVYVGEYLAFPTESAAVMAALMMRS